MVKIRNPRWCVAERRPTGPDKIFYLSTFDTREEAEEEYKRLTALPEKAGYRLGVTILPEERPRPKPPRKGYRRSRR
jgi:hypothetical protein